MRTRTDADMDAPHLRVLLVEDNPDDVDLLREMLVEAASAQLELVHVDRLADGLRQLEADRFDAILLDLSLPDSHGIRTFVRTHEDAPDVPCVVLSGSDDEALAVRAVQAGAQDYLVKGQANSNLLVRSIRYAVERHRMLEEIRSLTLVDELTGLYNRRGFSTLGEQQLRMARRTDTGLLLLFADVDNMKQINDSVGHQAGDQALRDTAKVMSETCRESDVVGRIGGDEFAVLAVRPSGDDAGALSSRLRDNLEAHGSDQELPYALSLSIGEVYHDPRSEYSIDELLAQADALMYEDKRSTAGA